MLDAEAYPHILTSIFAQATLSSLYTLRATSRTLRDQIDAKLASHVMSFSDGRYASRVAPTHRLPRPISDLSQNVKILDIQAPSVEWSKPYHPYESNVEDDTSSTLGQLSISASPNCRCGWPTLAPPPHLAPFADPAAFPNLHTVRRWGPHTCWIPPAAAKVTHFGGEADSEGGKVPDEVMWYIHSPDDVSRFIRLDLPGEGKVGGDIARYGIAGRRVAALFEMAEEMDAAGVVDSADEEDSDYDEEEEVNGQEGGKEGKENENEGCNRTSKSKKTRASLADGFAALLAMFWLDDPEEEEAWWALVDVEKWSVWAESSEDVVQTIRKRVSRCCAHADWNAEEMAAIDEKLRFMSAQEYRAEVGEGVWELEMDDHGWVFK